ncbi:MAG: cobalamin biosynthesis protein CbiG [Actinomycetota bacterium]
MEIDRAVAVDWSAANRPVEGPNSIWIADRGPAGDIGLANPPTRAEALTALRRIARVSVAAGERLVIGVDASFGYPVGFAGALGGREGGWRGVWAAIGSAITDDDRNRSNRFGVAAELNRRLGGDPGPFWACPSGAAGPDLTVHRGPMPMRTHGGTELAEYRLVERHLRARSRLVHSVWKLFTPGSVGSQTLLAIARLGELRRDQVSGPHTVIWPFEVDHATLERRPLVVVVELWPELADPDVGEHPVRDAAQVLAAARWIARLAATDELAPMLLLDELDEPTRRAAITEEGWILGAERVR